MSDYIVCFSPTGTTKKVAMAIAKGMRRPFEVIDISVLRKRNKSLFFTKDDTVIIGAPVYAGRIPDLVEKYYDLIDGGGANAIPLVVYGNRHYDDALLQLDDLCKRVGFKTRAAAAFIGEHSYTKKVATNRPDAADLEKATEFGAIIDLEDKVLKLPGNRPYRPLQNRMPIAPVTLESCDSCGYCADHCPVGAVDLSTMLSDENKCITCHNCVKNCPQGARQFDERILPIVKRLETNCQIRKEPETFL